MRGARVVYETESRMSVSRASSALTSVVLPPPDGAAITNRLPTGTDVGCPVPPSLKVLHLLAHLLDQHLDLERCLRELRIDRLRAEGVRLAMQLLHEEVEPLPCRAACRKHPSHFADMRCKARDLLRHVHLGGE